MNLVIRSPRNDDLKKYTQLLQETYEKSYTNEELGLTKKCFSKEVFSTPNTQAYLKSNLEIKDDQKTWLSFLDTTLVGSLTISSKNDKLESGEVELRGFYIKPSFQNKGIGKKMWNLALEFVKNKDIVLDIYAHNTKTIKIYKSWGFNIDKTKGEFYRHWPEWPQGVRAKCIYMRYSFNH